MGLERFCGSGDVRPKGLLFSCPGMVPKGMDVGVGKFHLFVHKHEAISKWAAKDDLHWRKIAVWVMCVAQLQYRTQESVVIKVTCGSGVRHQQAFCHFNCNFCPAVGLWEAR